MAKLVPHHFTSNFKLAAEYYVYKKISAKLIYRFHKINSDIFHATCFLYCFQKTNRNNQDSHKAFLLPFREKNEPQTETFAMHKEYYKAMQNGIIKKF